jgi:opacity protein-like surface antigen
MISPFTNAAAGDGPRPTARLRRQMLSACAAAVLSTALAGQAMAADMPEEILRGTFVNNGPVHWEGLSFGATMGLSSMNADYGSSTSSQVAFTLRNTTLENEQHPSTWTALPSNITNGRQFGAFIGYNMQWQELVLGADMAYNKFSSLESSTADTISRQVTLSDGTSDGVTIAARGSIKLIDYATFRGRAGYAFGQFLPYAVVGVGVGRFNYSLSTDVTVDQTPSGGTTTRFVFPTVTQTRSGIFSAGPLVGLGLDVAILPNVFLRAEWEFVAFAPLSGIRATTNTGRVGIGMRF